MQAFEYLAAQNVAEVVALLCSDKCETRLLSGGTDLLVQLREGRRQAGRLIDVKGIAELNELSFDAMAGLGIGAAVPCHRICGDAAVAAAYPVLIDAVGLIGSTQIRGRASLGGNLCNASPAADSIPALIAHGAVAQVAGPSGTRCVPVERFCSGPGRTVLASGEFLVRILIPPPPAAFGAHYLRFTPRNDMDIAVVGAGVSVVLDVGRESFVSARIALGAVAPTPLYVAEVGAYLAGRLISDECIAESARIAQAAAHPIDDMRGTAAQRRHLVGVLVRRALVKAIERAR
jgi:CO/xanthine dehydrogenase FAD-binding subunit